MSQVDRHLGYLILKEHFGDIVASVANVLIAKGRLQAAQLSRFTQRPLKQIHQCLFVLMQHGLVTYAETTEGTRVAVYYTMVLENVLWMDQIPLVIMKCGQLFGDVGIVLVKYVLKHGRLSTTSIVKLFQEEHPQIDKKDIMDAYQSMLGKGLLVSVSPHEMETLMDRYMKEEKRILEGRGEAMTSQAKAKLKKELAFRHGLEEGRLPSNSHERTIKKVYDLDDMNIDYETGDVTLDNDVTEEKPAEFEKRETLLFRFNFKKLHVLCRQEDIIQRATQRINGAAGRLLRVLLEESERQVHSTKTPERTIPLSYHTIDQMIDFHHDLLVDGSHVTQDSSLQIYLKTLAADQFPFIYQDSQVDGGSFSCFLTKQSTHMKVKLILDMVHDKFGAVGQRLWNVLYLNGKLEEKMAGKLCMSQMKETRETLYGMLKRNYVFIQDVPKSNDHTATRTIFLWSVNMNGCIDALIQELYKTLQHLKQRREFERQKHKILIDKLSRTDVQENMDELLSEGEKMELHQMTSVLHVLCMSEMKVNESIMILRDY